MKLTKNRLYNEIMKEVDIITSKSYDPQEMIFKLSGLASKIQQIVEKKYK